MEKLKTMNELMRYYDHRIEDLELKLAIAEEENAKLKARSLSTSSRMLGAIFLMAAGAPTSLTTF